MANSSRAAFEAWWDSSSGKATPETYRGWQESCWEAWQAARNDGREGGGIREAADAIRNEPVYRESFRKEFAAYLENKFRIPQPTTSSAQGEKG